MTPLAASISDATIWSVTFDETRSVTFDDTRSVDYDRNSFIIQATDVRLTVLSLTSPSVRAPCTMSMFKIYQESLD